MISAPFAFCACPPQSSFPILLNLPNHPGNDGIVITISDGGTASLDASFTANHCGSQFRGKYPGQDRSMLRRNLPGRATCIDLSSLGFCTIFLTFRWQSSSKTK